MLKNVALIIYYVSVFSVFIPIFSFLRRNRNFQHSFIKPLGILLLLSATADLSSLILYKLKIPNIFIGNTYIFISLFVFSYIYLLFLQNKKIIYATAATFFAFFLVNIFLIQPFSDFQSWLFLLEAIIVVIYSVSYYNKLFKTNIDLIKFPSFWFNTAMFTYFTFNIFLFIIINYIIKNVSIEISTIYWSFHNFNNALKNILFAVAIGFAGRQK